MAKSSERKRALKLVTIFQLIICLVSLTITIFSFCNGDSDTTFFIIPTLICIGATIYLYISYKKLD